MPSPNRLAQETSPYLLQHAHNPVDWYPWGPEALQRAEREDRPILLSIGYAACHWCHVMERESFEDAQIAALMNEHFVCIKVDREERPDLDDVYMAATIAMTGAGGWPMTVFLTPERSPFFAGTYFPPRDRPGQLGFTTLLDRIARLWEDDRDQLFRQAGELLEHLRKQSELDPPQSIAAACIERAVSQLSRAYDAQWGGFGTAPKFPPSSALHLLLCHHQRTGDAQALQMVTRTLDAMKDGGLYDQLAGGFARYSTDERWFAPHFEKMLYDNAQLARIYLEAYQVTQRKEYERVTRETLDYVLREMQSPDGGYYSATDADSEGEEGKYFTFTTKELRRILEPEETRAFCAFYGVTESGNWEGRNILHVKAPAAHIAEQLKLEPDELESLLRHARAKVFAERQKRVAPLLDDKVLVSWNALMLGSMAEAGRVLGEQRYVASALRAAAYLIEQLRDSAGNLLRTARAGKAHVRAYLEDHALLADALVDVYEASGDARWLSHARQLATRLLADFADTSSGAFFQTSREHEELIVRTRDGADGALPNANSVAARALLRLAWHLDEPAFESAAHATLRAYGQRIERLSRAHLSFLSTLALALQGPVELVFAGSWEQTQALRAEVAQHFLPQRLIVHAQDPGAAILAQGKTPLNERGTLYLCRQRVCELPITSAADVAARLPQLRTQLSATRLEALRGAPLPGLASSAGTRQYFEARNVDASAIHVLPQSELHLSRVGFGAYRVHPELADHRRALLLALRSGCNVIDTAATYTGGGSERTVGDVLTELTRTGEIAREQIVVCSKLGMLQPPAGADLSALPGAVSLGRDLAYSLHPDFLEQQLSSSLQRLNLQALDVCFLHNPEALLHVLPANEVWARLTEALVWLEQQHQSGRIGGYGVSCSVMELAAAGADDAVKSLNLRALSTALETRGLRGFCALGLPLNPLEPNGWQTLVIAEAHKQGWAVFTHRALNALPEGELWRLTDAPLDPDAPNLAEARAGLAALEQEFRSRLGSVLAKADPDSAAEQLFNWAGRIGEREVASRAHWNEFERAILAPELARVLSAFDQAFAGKQLGQVWREFRNRYVQHFEAMVRAARHAASYSSNQNNEPIVRHLRALPGSEEQPKATLAQRVVWAMGSLPGVSSVLVGMRDPSYVRDATETLRWPAMSEPEAVFDVAQLLKRERAAAR